MSKRTERRMVLTVGEEITQVNIIDGGKAVEILFSISESDEKKSEAVEPNVGSQEFEEMFPIVDIGNVLLDDSFMQYEPKTPLGKRIKESIIKAKTQEFEEMFPIVDIENVSLDDSFMQYEPKTPLGKRIKESIIKAKTIEMKNFRIPAMDPSLDDDGETIIYCAGRKPAEGKSAQWWYENAPKFMPSKNSRLQNDLQADVVLGVMLIKYLVEEKGYQVEEAWKAVCVDSKGLGHFWNSENAKYKLETTGSRQIGKCFDLGNTFKIVKKRKASGFVSIGAGFYATSWKCPLASAFSIDDPDYGYEAAVGALVLDV